MKQLKYKFAVFCFCILVLPDMLRAQADSLSASYYFTRTMMYGVGLANVYDTYLSPQEYKGIDFRLSRENMRMSKKFDGNVSIQNFFLANIAYTHNQADNNNTISGLFNWNYGMHYNFRVTNNFKILLGGLGDFNGGFVYNLHNSNNPTSIRAYINLDVSGMLVWDLKIKNRPFTLRYQANAPFVGVFFSPNYGQSYYEILTLGNYSGVFKLTSFHKQLSIRQMLSVDIPIRYAKIRFTYLWDMQQSKVNNLQTHTYGHVFMVGAVKEFYRIKRKRQ
ncbi:DUF3316 domain-containing protein [Bacteroides sp. 224]|uniref:DUF3316 domain-containing protein n=1 Tax=Bacteroides sp. 224 TaxID=2302936 RepID=UPI0013D837B8|nr:DUF3316 domain-containing protein [Bacteroides sp. 224]NDV64153.1 DUF3316 domain-containing protein [Bacteroides sp. 224]